LPADEPEPTVSLLLSRVSADRTKSSTLFRCEVSLDNATGRDLTVRSTFSSVFDGLELVVTNKEGKTLVQQAYISHQAPFAPPGREFPVKKGTTMGKLVFPVRVVPGNPKEVKVRLVGTLPGSGLRRILSTETITVKIKE